MIAIDNGAAQDLYNDLLQSAQGTLPTERATAPLYRRLAGELRNARGSADYTELPDELVEVASQFGYIG